MTSRRGGLGGVVGVMATLQQLRFKGPSLPTVLTLNHSPELWVLSTSRTTIRANRTARLRPDGRRAISNSKCFEDHYFQTSESWANPVFPHRDMCAVRPKGRRAMAQKNVERGFGEIPMLQHQLDQDTFRIAGVRKLDIEERVSRYLSGETSYKTILARGGLNISREDCLSQTDYFRFARDSGVKREGELCGLADISIVTARPTIRYSHPGPSARYN